MADRVSDYVARADDDADDDSAAAANELPRLADMFSVGQLVRSVIVRLESEGSTRRIELTLRPTIVNRGWAADTVQPGMVVYGAVKSIEGMCGECADICARARDFL
jgi:hypothetical protein